MRIKLPEEERRFLFSKLKVKFGCRDNIAALINVSGRTVTDWRSGNYSMPSEHFEELISSVGLTRENFIFEELPDYWNAHDSGRQGALERMRLYGDLGTPEGRRKGGLISAAKRRANPDSRFITLKTVYLPELSERLAELLGICMGDGHLSDYQLSITTNSETDLQHAQFVAQIIYELFGVEAHLQFRKDQKAVDIIASSKTMTDYLNLLGMPRGDKIKNNISVPGWIRENLDYQKAVIRGLFDTDGCIYCDRHNIKGKTYYNLGWTITSYADTLRTDILDILQGLGFSPKCRAPFVSVFLRRQKEIERYFDEIGTHNEKHLYRFQNFLKQTVGCAEW